MRFGSWSVAGASCAMAVLAWATIAAADAPAPGTAVPEAPAPDEDFTRGFDLFFDVAVLRPMGLLQLAIGSAMLPPAYALTWFGGAQDEVLDLLFFSPFDHTFRRPLGEF